MLVRRVRRELQVPQVRRVLLVRRELQVPQASRVQLAQLERPAPPERLDCQV